MSSIKNFLIIVWLFASSLYFIPPTGAYFTARSVSFNNLVQAAGSWDKTPPVSKLIVDDGLVVEERVKNGHFESDTVGSEWQTTGKIQRVGQNEEFEVKPQKDSYMVRVGENSGSGDWLTNNILNQLLNPGTKNLSFWYNFYTYDDILDQPGFMMLINNQVVWDLFSFDLFFNVPSLVSGYPDYPSYTDWRQVYVDLTQFGNTALDTSFYSGNTGDNQLPSWVYLDQITTTEVTAKADTQFRLESNEPADHFYQIQKNDLPWKMTAWKKLTDPFFTLASYSSGEYTLYYRSIDSNGNIETPQACKVHLDKIKPNRITDLAVDAVSSNTLVLSWTVPPDNGERPASLDFRYWERGEGRCLIASWEESTTQKIDPNPMPRFPEEIQDLEINGLVPNTAYCFAVKACDAALNCSSLSNLASGATLANENNPELNSREVIINELMWMGSKARGQNDEWIELKNTTDQDIDLSDWQFSKKKSNGTEDCMYTFPAEAMIKAHDYIVVSEYDAAHSAINIPCPSEKCFVVGTGTNPGATNDTKFSLANTRLQVKLYNGNLFAGAKVIDTADDGVGEPAAGELDKEQDRYFSMERNDFPGNGTLKENWHTCLDINSIPIYWDPGAVERGTPGGPNLSIEPILNFYYLDQHTIGFKLVNIAQFDKLTYEITYESVNREPQGIFGEINLNHQTEITKDGFILGTQSGEDWVYDEINGPVKLKIILSNINTSDVQLNAELN